MSGERDLAALLATMEPELQPGRYVFTTTTRVPKTANPVALIREAEGVALVLDQDQAESLELPYTCIAAMITLRVSLITGRCRPHRSRRQATSTASRNLRPLDGGS